MKIYFYFLITIFFVIIPCVAMENNVFSIKEITIIATPKQAHYLSNDLVVITNDNSCNIVNWKTNTIVTKLNDFSNQRIKVYPEKKIILSCYDNKLVRYDRNTITEHLFEAKKKITAFDYNPLKEIAFMCYGDDFLNQRDNTITYYDYKEVSYKNVFALMVKCQYLTAHPQQKQFVTGSFMGNMELYSLENEKLKFDQKFLSVCVNPLLSYSSDGCYFAIVDKLHLYIRTTKRYNEVSCRCLSDYDHTKHICFHPNNFILARSSYQDHTKKYYISYWNIKTAQIVDMFYYYGQNSYDISFSSDGTKILITADDKCMIFPVSLEVLLQDNTKKQLLFGWFILQQLKTNYNLLHGDFVLHSGSILYKIFKR